jgi:antitoxin VapB
MALNIKNHEVERLAAEVATLTGESKTEVIRRALEERNQRLAFQVPRRRRGERFLRFLEEEIWPTLPPHLVGRPPTRAEEDEILGYGPEGV